MPLFIGGTGRSGTTILARVVGRHPDVHTMRWETQFLTHRRGLVGLHERGYRWRDRVLLTTAMLTVWYRRVLRKGLPDEYEAGLHADLGWWTLARALLVFQWKILWGRGRSEKRLAACRDLVSNLFDHAAAKNGATRWCEKTPSNLLHFPELAKMFPDARFVHMVRDPRDVVCSMLKRGFWPISSPARVPQRQRFSGKVDFENAVHYWKELMTLALGDEGDMDSSHVQTIRLEDLVEAPRETIKRLLEFAELPSSEGIIDDMLRLDRDGHGELVPVASDRANIARWRTELSEEQLRYLEGELAALMDRFGYERVTHEA